MDTSKLDLPTLIRTKDHLNVLRYIRVFELREPELVLEHGQAWLGEKLNKSGGVDGIIRQTSLEQIAFAALDLGQSAIAEKCLDQLKAAGIPPSSIRFRRLLARCLEASGDLKGADLIYKELTNDTETPANSSVFKRLYALHKSETGDAAFIEGQKVLTDYLEKHPTDAAAWYELAACRKSLGDFSSAAFCLEECMLASSPLDATLHVELAECWATTASKPKKGGSSTLQLLLQARQHMAQALELDPDHIRAAWGLLQCSNLYLQYTSASDESSNNNKKKEAADPFQDDVAVALMEHAAAVLKAKYAKTPMETAVQKLVEEYLE
mmetsp:Transcript_8049/g.10547  ORF Transcript_8049/g.10547 Transcript_8049/m.10547 type:complete len:324 (-) Transcript_8049:81-1052(-)